MMIEPKRRFGRWEVLEKTSERRNSQIMYLCRCACGKERLVDANSLTRGKSRSCGCLRSDIVSDMDDNRKLGREALIRMNVDGTIISSINEKRKVNKNSGTGVRGVCHFNGKYRAYISLRRNRQYLGIFDTLAAATTARKEAETRLYKPVIDKWKKEQEAHE